MELVHARKIITMNPARPHAESLVLDGGRIEFVGSRAEAEERYGMRADLHRTDLGAAVVIPGFNDNHLHALSMGQFFASPRIAGMDAQTIVSFLRDVWRNEAAGELLVARGWDYPECPNPQKDLLDKAFPDNPVVLIQYSGHGAWLNGRALALFRINCRTRDPEGGRIERDGDGRPTGILTDDAVRPIHHRRFRQALSSYRSAAGHLSEALRRFGEVGITSAQDNTWLPRAVGYYGKFRKKHLLTCRLSCWSYGEARYGDPLFELRRFDSEWVTRGPVKLFLDGTFSTRTAWLVDPYPDAVQNRCGTATHTQEWLNAVVARYAGRGRQIAAHAIGDGAARSYTDAVEDAVGRDPSVRDLRIRIEHGQLIHPREVGRLGELGMLVAAQPHAAVNPAKDLAILGEERSLRAYPYRSLLDAGVPLSFGSDVPGEETYNPLYGMQLAVHRDGPEAISAEEALRAYT
ncbi:MAG: amidohydrolase family protein, partial [Spirochaetaceae bacterium]|nr:amidohydrolase family protein [Spirochaetaceae bacterium]